MGLFTRKDKIQTDGGFRRIRTTDLKEASMNQMDEMDKIDSTQVEL